MNIQELFDEKRACKYPLKNNFAIKEMVMYQEEPFLCIRVIEDHSTNSTLIMTRVKFFILG